MTAQDFLRERLEKDKAALLALDEAIAGLLDGSIQSYTLDTTQSRQTVTKQQIGSLYSQQAKLIARIETLYARLCGGGEVVIRPGF